MNTAAYQALHERVAELHDLRAAMALLEWDQEVYMPEGAANSRAAQSAALARIEHEKAAGKEIGDLLALCRETDFPAGSMERDFIRKVRRQYEKERVAPASLVAEICHASSLGQSVWMKARANSDFGLFAPCLKRLVQLKGEYAALFPGSAHPYDPLLDDYEEGLTVAQIEPVFQRLRTGTVEVLNKIKTHPQPGDAFLHMNYDEAKQLDFCRSVVTRMGYDWSQGRLDLTMHPFTTSFGLHDVRITTRTVSDLPMSCIFSCIHECGHALYEQHIAREFDRTPFADGASLAFHESQSRLWENQLGRSRSFWRTLFPELQNTFPVQLSAVPFEDFYRAVNRVQPDFIRTEADEVTYNLHILLRYELEKSLFDGSLQPDDLPARWNAMMQNDLGITPPDDAHGVLQDVHWACGLFGYFPTYALGNLLSAQYLALLRREIPDLDDRFSAGDFQPVLRTMTEHLYHFGARHTPDETRKLSLGTDAIDSEPFLQYLNQKYLTEEPVYG